MSEFINRVFSPRANRSILNMDGNQQSSSRFVSALDIAIDRASPKNDEASDQYDELESQSERHSTGESSFLSIESNHSHSQIPTGSSDDSYSNSNSCGDDDLSEGDIEDDASYYSSYSYDSDNTGSQYHESASDEEYDEEEYDDEEYSTEDYSIETPYGDIDGSDESRDLPPSLGPFSNDQTKFSSLRQLIFDASMLKTMATKLEDQQQQADTSSSNHSQIDSGSRHAWKRRSDSSRKVSFAEKETDVFYQCTDDESVGLESVLDESDEETPKLKPKRTSITEKEEEPPDIAHLKMMRDLDIFYDLPGTGPEDTNESKERREFCRKLYTDDGGLMSDDDDDLFGSENSWEDPEDYHYIDVDPEKEVVRGILYQVGSFALIKAISGLVKTVRKSKNQNTEEPENAFEIGSEVFDDAGLGSYRTSLNSDMISGSFRNLGSETMSGSFRNLNTEVCSGSLRSSLQSTSYSNINTSTSSLNAMDMSSNAAFGKMGSSAQASTTSLTSAPASTTSLTSAAPVSTTSLTSAPVSTTSLTSTTATATASASSTSTTVGSSAAASASSSSAAAAATGSSTSASSTSAAASSSSASAGASASASASVSASTASASAASASASAAAASSSALSASAAVASTATATATATTTATTAAIAGQAAVLAAQ